MLQEPPAVFLRLTIDGFELEPDLATLADIRTATARRADERARQLADAQQTTAQLEQQVVQLEQQVAQFRQATLTVSTAAALAACDEEKLALAKQLNDGETLLNATNLQLLQLHAQFDEADRALRDHNDAQLRPVLQEAPHASDDASVLRLKVYRLLGVLIEPRGDGETAVLYSKQTGTTSVLPLDGQYLDYFVANYLWERV